MGKAILFLPSVFPLFSASGFPASSVFCLLLPKQQQQQLEEKEKREEGEEGEKGNEGEEEGEKEKGRERKEDFNVFN
ncbi:hypothetical protein AXF42_Ash019605 [Apostasia shenzhenica]|uniref:Uncharacterized protein n=1 Tax=Apostasia shenzhenica TaxID=1088818 RepID=A0A2I0A3F9_9ASPA|nr:hypothetical protein AXF42_Ash019605 [Apostasia shenzhenica]